MITTPAMGLTAWNSETDVYSSDQLAINWTRVDQHDHSPGKGVQIPTAGIADQAVTAAKFAADAFDSLSVPNNSVGTSQLVDGAVTNPKLATNAVTSAKISAGAVDSTQLASNSVTSAKIPTNAVGASQIAAGAVGTTKIAANAVTSDKVNLTASVDILSVETGLNIDGTYLSVCNLSGLVDGGKYLIIASVGIRLASSSSVDSDLVAKARLADSSTFADPFIQFTTLNTGGPNDFFYSGTGVAIRTLGGTNLHLHVAGSLRWATPTNTKLAAVRIF